MVKVRDYKDTDFEEIVEMYYQMCLEVYPHRKFKSKQHFYKNVLNWIEWNYDIIVTVKDEEITGFTMCYFDSMGGICEDYYVGECIYVKPKYRKTRSAYLMYHTAINYADSLGMILSTNASDITESSHISKKLGVRVFTKFEKLPQGEQNEDNR